MSDTYFRVFSGLLTPEHQERIGKAIWTYLWLLNRITEEPEHNGERSGRVLYGRPVSYSYIGDELGLSKSTVKRQCESLQAAEYISMDYTPRGNIFSVKRSKKWTDPESDRAKIGTLRAENGTHDESDRAINGTKCAENDTLRAENGTLEFSDRAKNGTKRAVFESDRAENDYSNIKDINNNIKDKEIKDKKEAATDPETLKIEILNEFVRLRGSGFNWSPNDEQSALEIIRSGVSVSETIKFMQEKFADHNPKHSRDRINSLSYCVGYILDRYQNNSSGPTDKEAEELANTFLQSILKLLPDFSQPNMSHWSNDMQKLLSSGKSPERVKEIMEFAHEDSFWQPIILSPAKLADKFDQLAMQKKSKHDRKEKGKPNAKKDQLPKWLVEEKNAVSTTEQGLKPIENEQSFEEMLEELRARKNNNSHQHT